MLLCISVGVGLLAAAVLLRLFFTNLPDLVEAIFRPSSATVRLAIGATLAIAVGVSAYYILPRQIPRLARSSTPKATAATTTKPSSKPIAVRARTNPTTPTNSTVTQTPRLPDKAAAYGVKHGDSVQISAIHPPIALRSAVITSMDDTQLTVRANSGSFTVLWKNLTEIEPATTVTNRLAR